ncbi:MAG: nitroreductase family protein [candidate division KSB1 bacterium]|nr:nitroreductase family protein [candidate division KSB1 bacterium]
MNLYQMIQKRRSVRQFKPAKLPYTILERIVDSGRLAPSARNWQPLEFIVVDDPDVVNSIFELTSWAGYLKNNQGRPAPGKEPTAYIVIVVRKDCQSKWIGHDVGAAVENMILTALEKDIASCWLGSIQREKAAHILNVPETHEIDSALALGYPDEKPVAVPLSDSIKYFKDKQEQLHVPKRSIKSVLHHNGFQYPEM